jgi:hypothetical protein
MANKMDRYMSHFHQLLLLHWPAVVFIIIFFAGQPNFFLYFVSFLYSLSQMARPIEMETLFMGIARNEMDRPSFQSVNAPWKQSLFGFWARHRVKKKGTIK